MWIRGSEITDHIMAYPTALQQRCCHSGSGKFPALKQAVLKEKEGGGWRRRMDMGGGGEEGKGICKDTPHQSLSFIILELEL